MSKKKELKKINHFRRHYIIYDIIDELHGHYREYCCKDHLSVENLTDILKCKTCSNNAGLYLTKVHIDNVRVIYDKLMQLNEKLNDKDKERTTFPLLRDSKLCAVWAGESKSFYKAYDFKILTPLDGGTPYPAAEIEENNKIHFTWLKFLNDNNKIELTTRNIMYFLLHLLIAFDR